MQKLREIKATYDWFFKLYEVEVAVRTKKNDIAGIDKMEAMRDTLERGIFVLMFGQFERAVNLEFDAALGSRSKNPDWSRRRGWDAPALLGKKVSFDTKLAMVLDRQSSAFGKILHTYATRNHCAHGGTTDAVGSIDALEADIYRWCAELRR